MYDFSTINDKDFEILVKDLLNTKFGYQLQSFKSGKDKGIDLRYSTPENTNALVVQAKHYLKSGYSQLKSVLKNKEYPKLEVLKPDRYIVTTSVSLSPQEKDELKTILAPFVQSENDIIGQEDLNSYLSEFPDIEKGHYKLWFSSTAILQTIVNNAVEARSRHLLEEIQKRIPLYVVTKRLDDAHVVLSEHKILLITGQPGVGKTSLAEMLVYELASRGMKIHKVESIAEAENVLVESKSNKHLFYFDDFLGANYNEIVGAGKTESQLTSFVKRVQSMPSKYLLLTTRSVILNQAYKKYEKISHLNLTREQVEIELKDYTKLDKAKILYNHCFFCGVREELYEQILESRFYVDIVNHKNYTPRLIEFITDRRRLSAVNSVDYRQFIENSLNNPQHIWESSFNNQIEFFDRCMLLTLLAFRNGIEDKFLREAFQARLQYEKQVNNQVLQSNQFNSSMSVLLNGFVKCILSDNIAQYSFINPSVGDFLLNYIKGDEQEQLAILKSACFYGQLDIFNPKVSQISLSRKIQEVILQKVSEGGLSAISYLGKVRIAYKSDLTAAETLCRYCKDVDIDDQLLALLKIILAQDAFSESVDKTIYILRNVPKYTNSYDFLKRNLTKIIIILIDAIYEQDEAEQIPELFEEFEENYNEFLENEESHTAISNMLDVVVREHSEFELDDLKGTVTDISEVERLYDELNNFKSSLMGVLLPNEIAWPDDFDVNDDKLEWEHSIQSNLMDEEKSKGSLLHRTILSRASKEDNDDEEIDRLFSQ